MTWQTFARPGFLLTASALLLSGCITLDFNEAEPEKYMGYDCEQLAQFAESYRPRPQDILDEDDFSKRERMNEPDNRIGVRDHARPYQIAQEQDRRSIALARRQKGCL